MKEAGLNLVEKIIETSDRFLLFSYPFTLHSTGMQSQRNIHEESN